MLNAGDKINLFYIFFCITHLSRPKLIQFVLLLFARKKSDTKILMVIAFCDTWICYYKILFIKMSCLKISEHILSNVKRIFDAVYLFFSYLVWSRNFEKHLWLKDVCVRTIGITKEKKLKIKSTIKFVFE